MQRTDELMEKLDALSPLLDKADDPQLKVLAKFLAERISSPESFVTFLGETSSGKTTLINGLLGKPLLPMMACPTTGAICEVMLRTDQKEDSFYAINKNATIEKLDKKTALSLIRQPDKDLSRVRIVTAAPDKSFGQMRVFDTPGYDSIIEEHEEILKEFLPNSDVVIYTVAYRIGIQQNDYAFLGFLKELVREDTDIIVAVNRCPPGTGMQDRRIREIMQYARDILLSDVKCFIIPAIVCGDDSYPLPPAKEMWQHTIDLVCSPKREKLLFEAFDHYIADLYHGCRDIIEKRIAAAMLDRSEAQAFIEEQKASAERIRMAVDKFVIPGFNKLKERLPAKMDTAAKNAEERILSEIESTPTGKMEEMQVYVNAHLVPHSIRLESKELQEFISLSLESINQEVDDYLNTENQRFENKISIRLSTHKDTALKNIVSKVIGRTGYSALLKYFTSFGGAGQANAGIANAASHLLKKIGDTFGKTFSRETHNALKHTLSKIGATSMKAVGAALTAIIELGMVSLDYMTWKSKLGPKVRKAVKNWKDEALPAITDDLDKLMEENIKNINEIADERERAFTMEELDPELAKTDPEELEELCDAVGRRIGVL